MLINPVTVTNFFLNLNFLFLYQISFKILCKQYYIFVEIKHDRKFVKINNSVHVEINIILLKVKFDVSYLVTQSPD